MKPPRWRHSFTLRLSLALALLLLGYGLLAAVLGRQVAGAQEARALQQLSHGLARHIVQHWPEITLPDRDSAAQAERAALMQMLMTVNPGVQVYRLDANGRVDDYLGEPGMVRTHQVDLAAVRAFLAGATLPLRGTDPMGGEDRRLFSAAMFAPRPGDTRPPGYLYIVLDGAARRQAAAGLSAAAVWPGALLALTCGGLGLLALGLYTFARLTLPLRRLADRMHGYSAVTPQGPQMPGPEAATDEIHAIGLAFEAMTQRIEQQAARERAQADGHREAMAGLAHDLRTPLTALHGHLEALADPELGRPETRQPLLQAALDQSVRVRRLSQQLFELAALQATQAVQRERFSLDELVSDAVQKFALSVPRGQVCLGDAPAGRLELEGDLHLVERALANLIDNALRHSGAQAPVRVSLQRDGPSAQLLVEDSGPGLPAELYRQLCDGTPLRDGPARRTRSGTGGIGGLGLAIAQRIAVLHGGTLRPLPSPDGGARLCLTLPLAA